MLRLLTGGESHGPAVTAIVDGLPAGVPITREAVDRDLRRRQGGYGRGGRMSIEKDAVSFLSGIRHGKTLGTPVTLVVTNKDHENWADVMSPDPQPPEAAERRALHRPRPGHADLAGALKLGTVDLRNVLERASARETTSRVAAGAVVKQLLRCASIELRSHVLRIGDASIEGTEVAWERLEEVDESPVRCVDAEASEAMKSAIDAARKAADTVGGVFEVVARGVPAGLGSYAQWDRRLDGRLGQALMSIQAVKAASVGEGMEAGHTPGSRFHDEILLDGEGALMRPTNHAGGLEGGITNGEEIRVRGWIKPIPTLLSPLRSVDLVERSVGKASVERSDVCVVPAAGIVGEAMVALVLGDALLDKLGGDSLDELLEHLEATRHAQAAILRGRG